MSADRAENEPDSSSEMRKAGSPSSKFDDVVLTALRWWGVLFRALFICALGVIGWLWINPQSISDVPISQLTLKQIVGNILATLLAIWCVKWFLDFPEQQRVTEPKENPYIVWGQFGAGLILVAALAIYWLNK